MDLAQHPAKLQVLNSLVMSCRTCDRYVGVGNNYRILASLLPTNVDQFVKTFHCHS
jgi:hypothetical protein